MYIESDGVFTDLKYRHAAYKVNGLVCVAFITLLPVGEFGYRKAQQIIDILN